MINIQSCRKSVTIIATVLSIIAVHIACGDQGYSVFKVYPIPLKHRIAAGDSSFVALRVEIPRSYYIYGNPKGPGIGKPTTVTVKALRGIKFGPARFMEPEKHFTEYETEHTFIHRNETTIFLPFSVDRDQAAGDLLVSIQFDSQMCSGSECVLKNMHIDYPITIIGSGELSLAHENNLQRLFEQSKVPGGPVHVNIPAPVDNNESFLLNNYTFEPQTLELEVGGILQAVLFGLLAGFILNFMPCVLPVVSLKIMSFVQNAGKSKKELRILGILFSLGILSSFAVLASLAAFLGYSWGGLFQHRIFIIIMAAIVFALALSMFDVYTLNIPSFAGKAAKNRKNPYADAFFKGLLATLLATPCSGPFLGGTLAWALTQSPAVIFIIFMSVGAGMAIPYFIITLDQRIISLIPKPGEWMQTFERIMGFFLLFTVVYLISILDKDSFIPMVTLLCFIALGLWQFGKYGALFQKKITRFSSIMLLIAITAGGYYFSFGERNSSVNERTAEHGAYSQARLLESRGKGRISMVVFTADWCPNCKVVERFSLNTDDVAREIEKENVDVMVADMTTLNRPAAELLEKIGNPGKSIPYLAIFPGGTRFTRPLCLRDIYSGSDVIKAIRMAAGK